MNVHVVVTNDHSVMWLWFVFGVMCSRIVHSSVRVLTADYHVTWLSSSTTHKQHMSFICMNPLQSMYILIFQSLFTYTWLTPFTPFGPSKMLTNNSVILGDFQAWKIFPISVPIAVVSLVESPQCILTPSSSRTYV